MIPNFESIPCWKDVICKTTFHSVARSPTGSTEIDRNSCKYIRLAYNKQKNLWFHFNRNHRGFNRFSQDVLTKKETAFRLSLWCARRDLNSSLVEYMVFLKLLFAQNTCFVSNIPIFSTDIFTLILLRVPVRVKIRVIVVHILMC